MIFRALYYRGLRAAISVSLHGDEQFSTVSFYDFARPWLFKLDPEVAHALTLGALWLGLAPWQDEREAHSPVDVMGLKFPNRVGLAAGFDKNAVAVHGLAKLGFGFIEVGTVTPRPQRGNPRPRVFRLPQAHALINRLGFPNHGLDIIVARLSQQRAGIVCGVNIGKNATTPLDLAAADYVTCLRGVYDVADYVTLNVSSPNTRGLRSLQEPLRLRPMLSILLDERERLRSASGRHVPIAVKLSPDLSRQELEEIATLLATVGVDAVMAVNTTVARDGLADVPQAEEGGGLSGAPLFRHSLAVVRTLRQLLGPNYPIIGVGGIESAERALQMRAAGADLVQIYTGLVYRGPALVRAIARALG
jgi:dihydroorotate dehydrogenase